MNNLKYNNNYTISEELFDNILSWAANKNPSKTKEQICADIEKILDLVEKKGYNKAKNSCCGN